MSRDELIQKIKKLLTLSTDSSTTEHERELAYKRAQVLMAKYSISNLNNEKDIQDLVINEIYTKENLPIYLRTFNTTSQNFGCYLAFREQTNQVCIFGFKTNIEVLKYIFDTLINQGMFDYRVEYSKRREISFATAFWIGFQQENDEG